VVIRSLTKLFSIAGLRLGYALAQPERLARWASWRDPWPVNGLAAAVAPALLADPLWQRRVQRWVAEEGAWLSRRLAALPGLQPCPSAANFLLVRTAAAPGADPGADLGGEPREGLEPLRQALEQRHRILLRDCRSFPGLGPAWLRIGLQDRRGHRRLLAALRRELGESPGG
ncbi:MAG: aminotransferase class I/II-fold pyridoxal phosphate-dependent enzyme, partial [Cyanobacteriota bacterium]